MMEQGFWQVHGILRWRFLTTAETHNPSSTKMITFRKHPNKVRRRIIREWNWTKRMYKSRNAVLASHRHHHHHHHADEYLIALGSDYLFHGRQGCIPAAINLMRHICDYQHDRWCMYWILQKIHEWCVYSDCLGLNGNGEWCDEDFHNCRKCRLKFNSRTQPKSAVPHYLPWSKSCISPFVILVIAPKGGLEWRE